MTLEFWSNSPGPFFKYLNQNLKLDFDYLFRLPTKIIKREVGYGEIKNLCDITFLKYTALLKDYLPRFFNER